MDITYVGPWPFDAINGMRPENYSPPRLPVAGDTIVCPGHFKIGPLMSDLVENNGAPTITAINDNMITLAAKTVSFDLDKPEADTPHIA